ncbi:sulfatase-like hydrolase/transferase [Rhodopirellula sp.]|nr:sulfatase-like hydrolase/transferase [Rhodopirellula sp.]
MRIASFILCLLLLDTLHAANKPNIVFFLVDDLGLGDVGCFGSAFHETPHIDQLCADGLKFTQAYSACTVCSPSRAAILLGKYPARTNLTDWIAGHGRRNAPLNIPNWNMRMELSETTLPEALKEQGYKSQFVGKWHLMPIGADDFDQHYPTAHGFDRNIGGREWGQPKGPGKYFSPFGMPNLDDGEQGDFLTDALTDEAVDFIDANQRSPFFLYLSYYTVHGPIMAPPNLVQKYREKAKSFPKPYSERVNPAFAAMTELLDRSVGRVRAKLSELGLAENTIIVFTSDNGGTSELASAGLRGAKAFAYEGGTRVSTMVSWPGVTTPGSECNVPIIGNDFYPTLLEMSGADLLPKQHVDGQSLVPLLKKSDAPWERDELYWHYPHYHRTTPYGAIRKGNWKLIEFYENHAIELYNLGSDPAERTNLAKEQEAITADLLSRLNQWRSAVGAQMPTLNANYKPTAVGKPRTVRHNENPVSTPYGTISASSHQPGNFPHYSVDGDKTTRWAASNEAVPQWIQLDFGKQRTLSGVEIRFKNRTRIHYCVSISDNGSDWTKVHESNKPLAIQNEQVSFTAKSRYVRVTIEGIESGWATIEDWKPVHTDL